MALFVAGRRGVIIINPSRMRRPLLLLVDAASNALDDYGRYFM